MKTRNYIIGLTGLVLCAACSNEELAQPTTWADEVLFGATLQTSTAISTRGIGANNGETAALPYVWGIHIRKMEASTPVNNSQYEVLNGNKGTLTLPESSTEEALTWTVNEKRENTNITFYAWTQPGGVTLASNDANVTTGTVDFGDEAGNRAPKGSGEENRHKMNETFYTPLELFISAVTTGSYKDNPSVSLPFTHPVAKVQMEVYNWDNEAISSFITIQFPFINQTYTIEQKDEKAFAITGPTTSTAVALNLDFSKLAASGNNRIFYLPPVSFADAGDFVITYDNEKYYGTLDALSVKQLKAGDYMTCRIDLNKNYGTGVGATIQDWKFEENVAYANPYRGIYTTKGLEVLKDCLTNNKEIPDSLYIDENGKKIIRLYNDLDLTGLGDDNFSLVLKNNMVFDGLGHTIAVPAGKSLFGDISATENNTIAINNIRLTGAGQLATSTGTGVTVYNCHAIGTGNLAGTANAGTTFNFCSAENASNLLAGATNGAVTIQNCFVAYSGADKFAGGDGTITAKNSFVFDTDKKTGTYYAADGTTNHPISTDAKGRLLVTNSTADPADMLINLLNNASKTGDDDTNTYWVYVYGKPYPVLKIK